MRFTVPQFIEREAKLIGPLTFRQFLYIGSAGLICFIVYFSFSFNAFIITCIVLGSISSAFAFLKIDDTELSTYLWNFFKYSLSPKVYLWKKKGEENLQQEIEIKGDDDNDLSLGGKSNLKNIKTKIETKTK